MRLSEFWELLGRREALDRRRQHGCFNVDDCAIVRAEAAQLMAYWSGIAFLVEKLLPLVIGRPAVAADIPAGDPSIVLDRSVMQ